MKTKLVKINTKSEGNGLVVLLLSPKFKCGKWENNKLIQRKADLKLKINSYSVAKVSILLAFC